MVAASSTSTSNQQVLDVAFATPWIGGVFWHPHKGAATTAATSIAMVGTSVALLTHHNGKVCPFFQVKRCRHHRSSTTLHRQPSQRKQNKHPKKDTKAATRNY
jgi:hypothetical protein